jgi:hypothetical protein
MKYIAGPPVHTSVTDAGATQTGTFGLATGVGGPGHRHPGRAIVEQTDDEEDDGDG